MSACVPAEFLVGKAEARGIPGHRLPVVATGLIPCICRHAAFPHRATPVSLPLRSTVVPQRSILIE